MTAPELKPCPFCGGEAEIWCAHEGRTAWIACMGKCVVLVSKEHLSDDEAIAAWNRRADLAQPAHVLVKPLVWRESSAELPRHAWEAWSSLGRYVIVQHFIAMNSAVYRLNGNNYHTIQSAKSAAQADYEARILAAIEPQPISKSADLHDPRDEVIKGLAEALNREPTLIWIIENTSQVRIRDLAIDMLEQQRAALAAAKAVQHG